jgi:hypothetical protein
MERLTVTISGLVRSTKPLELSVYGRCGSIKQRRWKEHRHFNYVKSPRDLLSMMSIFRI